MLNDNLSSPQRSSRPWYWILAHRTDSRDLFFQTILQHSVSDYWFQQNQHIKYFSKKSPNHSFFYEHKFSSMIVGLSQIKWRKIFLAVCHEFKFLFESDGNFCINWIVSMFVFDYKFIFCTENDSINEKFTN